MMAHLKWYLDPLSSNQLKKKKKSWTPSEKLSGSAHELRPLSSVVVVVGGGGGGGGGHFCVSLVLLATPSKYLTSRYQRTDIDIAYK